MKLILVPGFWLNGSSWATIVPALEAAGHETESVTLPGIGSGNGDPTMTTLADQVTAVVERIDAADSPVVLVGHSGGGSVISLAADARPDRVARAIYVDAGPAGEGDTINENLPVVDGVIPLPDLDEFPAEMTRDMDEGIRAHFRSIAHPQPAHVATDAAHPADDRRYDVPSTVICCEMSAGEIRELIDTGHAYVAELARFRDYELVDLPTSHWPQFTKPAELAAIIIAAIR